jgi:hypothetical protein
MGEFDNMLDENDNDEEGQTRRKQDHVEISCPLFLRPLMKQILSVGKTIKIVRFLENNSIKQGKQVEDTMDRQSIDITQLAANHAWKVKNLPPEQFKANFSLDFLN